MVPLGLTHMHDAGNGDVLLCLRKLKNTNYRGQIDAIRCIIKIGLNLFDVTRCHGLHHKHPNNFQYVVISAPMVFHRHEI